jgi:pyrroloquinoline quinone biosynthesis protein E
MHEKVIEVVRRAGQTRDPDEQPITFRNDRNSRWLASKPEGALK